MANSVPKTFSVPNGWSGTMGQLIWSIILQELACDNTMGEGLHAWLRNAEVSLTGTQLEVRVWSRFQKEVVARRCVPRIMLILEEILPDVEIVVIVADQRQQSIS